MKLYGYLLFYVAVLIVKGDEGDLYCFTCDDCEEPFNNDQSLLQICNAGTMITPRPIIGPPPTIGYEPIYTGAPPVKDFEPIYTGPPPNLTQDYEPIYTGPPPNLTQDYEPIYTGPPPNLTLDYEPIYTGPPPNLTLDYEPIYTGPPPNLTLDYEPIYTGPPPNLTLDYEPIYPGPLPEVPVFAPIDLAPPPTVPNFIPADETVRPFYCFHVVGIVGDNITVSRRGCVSNQGDATCRLAVDSIQFTEYTNCTQCYTSECNRYNNSVQVHSSFILLLSSSFIFIILKLKN